MQALQEAVICSLVGDIRQAAMTPAERNAVLEEAAQLAFDQASDEPQPGDWNDACGRIFNLIRALKRPEAEPFCGLDFCIAIASCQKAGECLAEPISTSRGPSGSE